MVASFVKGKNQSGLLRAVSQIPRPAQPQLIFAGEGPERANCEALAQRLGLAERTRFRGRVDDLAPLFAASDVCVSTSLRDSLPNALIEAQAAGVPVVAYDVAGVSEAFLPNRSGYSIPPGHESALGAAIKTLLDDPEKAQAFGQAGRNWAGETFTPKTIASAYREWLGTICPAFERPRDLLEKRTFSTH
jgi:glycosyltransferase involved in cell wall biosynthesis